MPFSVGAGAVPGALGGAVGGAVGGVVGGVVDVVVGVVVGALFVGSAQPATTRPRTATAAPTRGIRFRITVQNHLFAGYSSALSRVCSVASPHRHAISHGVRYLRAFSPTFAHGHVLEADLVLARLLPPHPPIAVEPVIGRGTWLTSTGDRSPVASSSKRPGWSYCCGHRRTVRSASNAATKTRTCTGREADLQMPTVGQTKL